MRDRENTFEPWLIKKHQTRIIQMDSQILSLCPKGMTTREIFANFREMYDADMSDPNPKSCSIQKQNSGMINTPLNGGGDDEKVTIHRRADCLCPETGTHEQAGLFSPASH